MTPLRQRMIEDLRIRGLAQNTIDSRPGQQGGVEEAPATPVAAA